jgi:hypothetical protein
MNEIAKDQEEAYAAQHEREGGVAETEVESKFFATGAFITAQCTLRVIASLNVSG